MELGPLMVTGISERLSSPEGTGKVESVIINFQKDSVLLTKLERGFLAISADRVHALRTFEEVAQSIRELTD
jgi:predicted regulator of Ras-like GTPase activity (Roadblock/LC7/MglB family)